MESLKKNSRLSVLIGLILFSLQLSACVDCEESICREVLPREGALRIDTIYHKFGERGYTVANNKNGKKLLYRAGHYLIAPKIGDSIVKYKGEATYTLYTQDSVYVERYDCVKRYPVIISREKRVDLGM